MNTASSRIQTRVLSQMTGGLVVASLPVGLWWAWARRERHLTEEDVRTAIRLPGGSQDTYDYLITEKCQAGDVLLFDRRCERCASGPWAALSCLASKQFLTDTKSVKSVDSGRFDHMGIIVPGYIKSRHDEYDPTNLLLLEATPQGIVANPLKERLERSAAKTVILLQLCSPGEQRNVTEEEEEDGGMSSRSVAAERVKQHVERELRQFRDRWTALGDEKGYKWIHSTVGLGGALAYGLGAQDLIHGPISPSAFLVLMGLQQAAAAQNIKERENRKVKVEDFLRDYRFEDQNVVRLRPGWRFLAPINMIERSRN